MAIKENETITYSNMYNEATLKSQLKHEIISSAYNHKYIILLYMKEELTIYLKNLK